MAELFTEEWARDWGNELSQSEEYRQAASSWEGPIVLELKASKKSTNACNLPEDRAVLLDLWRGECRQARLADDDDVANALFVLRADLATWRTVLDGSISFLPAILRGKLKLRKGKLSALMPFTDAAKELVAAATRIETEFPGSV